ncbi:MAG: glycosyltransferase [Caldilineaceae bacterium]
MTQNTDQATEQTELPPTSLIICSRNRPQLLAETVASILAGDSLPTELIIIDQSAVANAALAELQNEHGCTIRYHWSQTTGLSKANNLGLALALHDLLVFTHDDVLVTPNWLAALVCALCAVGPRGVVTGQVRPTTEHEGGFQLTLKTAEKAEYYVGRIGQDVLYPLNMALLRSAFQEVGNFDERLGPGTPFPGAEDNDLGYRLLEAGYQIHYVPEAALYHRAWRREQDYLPLCWGYGCAQGAYYAKHLSLRDRYMLWRLRDSLRRHSRQFVQKLGREWRNAWGEAYYVLGLLYGVSRWTITYKMHTAHRR